MSDPAKSTRRTWYAYLVAAIIFLTGAALVPGGFMLIRLGGSSYYLITGIALVVAGLLLLRKKTAGAWLFAVVFLGTVLWSCWESGSDYWGWVPRLDVLTVLAFLLSLSLPLLDRGASKRVVCTVTGLCAVIFIGAIALAFVPYHVTEANDAFPARAEAAAKSPIPDADWPVYGRDKNATRFSPLKQLNADNVSGLQKIWTYRTGAITPPGQINVRGAETTPIKVGNAMFMCSALNDIIRLAPATGKEIWRYHSGIEWKNTRFAATCRGVVYYESTTAPQGAACHTRIIESTVNDGRWRLIGVDANTGKACDGFGEHGQVNLLEGMGRAVPGMVAEASPPPIVDGVIVTNHEVLDGQRRSAPSGVIRGFSAETGQLLWAWDVKHPERHGLPPAGETYSRGTPNSWAVMTGDDKLGLVYVPTGNSAVDYYSALRSPEENAVSSSVVALDVHTGTVRWVFQTVHKDVWDYDIGSQATLFDFTKPSGEKIPALVIPTKRGQLFVLDRQTGKPLTDVIEKPVPKNYEIPEDPHSPTQPWSVGMPRLGIPDLKETNMWGLTPFDQLYCRVQFKKARYDGEFTAPTLSQPWIEFPGNNGGVDWGSATYDPQTGVLVANWNIVPMYNQLLSRATANKLGLKAFDDPTWRPGGGGAEGPGAQVESPYAVSVKAFENPFTGVLCNEPPFGMMTAINMRTQQVIWQRPFGTARANGPFGLPTYMPIPFGVPSNGGSITTAGGLVFAAAATDNLLRAIDVKTGKVVWSDVLPAGGQATPMTYEIGGRQYVVVMAGGHHFMGTPQGDYVVAYALPEIKQ